MNKKIITGVGLVTALSLGLGVWFTTSSPTQEIKTTANDIKSFTIDDMSKIKNDEVYNAVGYKISFNTENFSSNGVISYVSSGVKGFCNTTAITGLTSVTVEVTSGSIEIYATYPWVGYSGDYAYSDVEKYGSGTGTVVADFGSASPDYFKIKAVGESATISSITINYTCSRKYHKMTTYFYTPYKPDNDVYMIINDNNEISNVDIRGGNLEPDPMTYVGQDQFGYHKYSYDFYSDFGNKEFIFVTHVGGNKVFVCDTTSGTGDDILLDGNKTSYCYSYKGFPRDTTYVDTYFNYPYELDGKGNSHIPTKTQYNITFAEGSSVFNNVIIKTNLAQTDYNYYTSLENTSGNTWTCSVLSVRYNYYNLYFEMTSGEFSGTANLVWLVDSWTAARVNNVNDNTAVVNITLSYAITSSGDYAISGETVNTTNCSFGAAS